MIETDDLEGRRLRAAKNQSLFREVNERVESLVTGSLADVEVIPRKGTDFICECLDETCTEYITLLLADYEAIRDHSTRFFVKPGHVDPEVEAVTEERGEYVVVEKLGTGAVVAAKLDPRKRAR